MEEFLLEMEEDIALDKILNASFSSNTWSMKSRMVELHY